MTDWMTRAGHNCGDSPMDHHCGDTSMEPDQMVSWRASYSRLRSQLDECNGVWADAVGEAQHLRAHVAELRELLSHFVNDEDECWFDHHGYCQAHGWTATDPACPHARAKAVLTAPSPEAE